ncbi:MAG: potassium-transporting ATPase subunit F [Verrucomicrobiales bacterium]|nr:potassium-transporting ATPase subunit F [Verrucomicrobiales bacterium]
MPGLRPMVRTSITRPRPMEILVVTLLAVLLLGYLLFAVLHPEKF